MPPSTPEGGIEIPPTAGLPLHWRDLLPPWPGEFAQGLADFLRVPALGVECSGTASLIVILETLRRLSGRKTVVIPAYTCPLVVLAAAHCGLQVRLCDVLPGSIDLDPEALARLCDGDTLALIPTHLGGRVTALEPVLSLARQCGAYVVEDAAQALGARWQGGSVGLSADAGFFSLAAGKGLSLFEGGLWIAADPGLRLELERTRQRLIPRRAGWEAWRCLQLLGYAAAYRPRGLRYVYGNPLRRALQQNDPIAAAGDNFSLTIPLHQVSAWRQVVGSRALLRLADFQQALAVQAAARRQQLESIVGVKVLTDPPGAEGVWPVLMVVLPSQHVRDKVLAELWGAGLGLARMFACALPDYDYLRPWLKDFAVPNAQEFAACSLTISNSPWLDAKRFERILNVLSRYCAEAA